MLRKPIHRASLLALGLFGLLVLITWKPEKKVSKDLADRKWPLELELQADLSGLATSHELVQDTLSWHTGKLAALFPRLKTTWQYQFCCDDALSHSRNEQVFRGKLTLEFPKEEMRFALLQELRRLGYVDPQSALRKGDWTCGSVNLALPVPDGSQVLELEGVGYGLQVQPGRVTTYRHS